MLAKEVKAKVSIQILLRINIFLTTVLFNTAGNEKSINDEAFKNNGTQALKKVWPTESFVIFDLRRNFRLISGTTGHIDRND